MFHQSTKRLMPMAIKLDRRSWASLGGGSLAVASAVFGLIQVKPIIFPDKSPGFSHVTDAESMRTRKSFDSLILENDGKVVYVDFTFPGSNDGTVSDTYTSVDHGGHKVAFYDEDSLHPSYEFWIDTTRGGSALRLPRGDFQIQGWFRVHSEHEMHQGTITVSLNGIDEGAAALTDPASRR